MSLATSDIASRTVTTLECAAQVRMAATSDRQGQVAADVGHQRVGARIGDDRSEQRQELVQGGQHQAQADQHPAEVVGRVPGAAEEDDAAEHEERREGRDVEGQKLDHQGGADIGAQHHSQRRRQFDQPGAGEGGQHQGRGRRALQGDGDRRPCARGLDPIGERAPQECAQSRAECPLHAGLHHVHAPQEQGGEAGQVEDYERQRDGAAPPERDSRTARAALG